MLIILATVVQTALPMVSDLSGTVAPYLSLAVAGALVGACIQADAALVAPRLPATVFAGAALAVDFFHGAHQADGSIASAAGLKTLTDMYWPVGNDGSFHLGGVVASLILLAAAFATARAMRAYADASPHRHAYGAAAVGMVLMTGVFKCVPPAVTHCLPSASVTCPRLVSTPSPNCRAHGVGCSMHSLGLAAPHIEVAEQLVAWLALFMLGQSAV